MIVQSSFKRLSGLVVLGLLIILFVQIHWICWYYFDIDIDAQKLLAEAATSGAVGLIYGFLPETNKRFLRFKGRFFLNRPSTRVTFIILVGVVTVSALVINRTKLKWPPGQINIVIDETSLPTGNWRETSQNSTSLYGFPFQQRTVKLGDFSESISFRPLVPLVYEIPETAVYPSRSEYRHITRLLALSFYQLVENRFLGEAKTRFTTDEGKKYVDLNAVYPIIELCFNGSDIARSGDKLLGLLKQESPNTGWLPLLAACLHYARGEFDDAVVALKNIPHSISPVLFNASIFFKSVNLLRGHILKSNRGEKVNENLLTQAISGFQEAADSSEKIDDVYFREIASGSANIFRGIAYVYRHDNDQAFLAFKASAKSTYPEIKARSFSDMGYVSLLRGSLSDAKSYFTKSLEIDPKFPYARTNIGYAMLADGQYSDARELFVKLANDSDLRRESRRDVILSQLAIAHIDAEKAPDGSSNPAAYDTPLNELTIFNYEGTSPALLRLINIRIAIADKIYMSHDYYGLEMFALAMYARAYIEAKSLSGNQEAFAALKKAGESFRTVAAGMDPRCFIFHTPSGFFKPVTDLAQELNLTASHLTSNPSAP